MIVEELHAIGVAEVARKERSEIGAVIRIDRENAPRASLAREETENARSGAEVEDGRLRSHELADGIAIRLRAHLIEEQLAMHFQHGGKDYSTSPWHNATFTFKIGGEAMQYCAYCGNAVEAVSYVPCPRCGNPTNGAPRPAAAAKGSNTAIVVVLVIVGLLVVVAILGIVSAIAIPNFLTAMQRAKQKRTMADIRSLGAALEAYSSDNNQYPKTTDGLAPKYIKSVPAVDGWGHELHYTCIKYTTTAQSETCTGYAIASAGKDGRFERPLDALSAQESQQTSNFDCDIVYAGGEFVEYPEGVQH